MKKIFGLNIKVTSENSRLWAGFIRFAVLKEGVNFNIGHNNKKDKKEDDRSGKVE
jgi:hypothetical protein